jgi:hypothetical protein
VTNSAPAKHIGHAICELFLHSAISAVVGFRGVHALLTRSAVQHPRSELVTESMLCRAVSLAISFFPKRVRCLQRSAVTVRLLRKHGIPADLVVGYRPAPFFSHAWVEVDGRVVNDDTGYQRCLIILFRC